MKKTTQATNYPSIATYPIVHKNSEFLSKENTLNKTRLTDIYIRPSDFWDRTLFISKLKVLDHSSRYSILFRVCFGVHPSFKMLGGQISLNYLDNDNIDSLHKLLHDNLIFRLTSSMLNYNYSGESIITIQLLAYIVEYTENVLKPPKIDLGV